MSLEDDVQRTRTALQQDRQLEPSPQQQQQQQQPVYHLRASSRNSASSQQVEAPPAYVLGWDGQGCHRTLLSTPDELRSVIGAGQHAQERQQRLIVLHGLPADFLKVIRSSLDIDPAFIEAHAGRRRYRPLRWRRDARFAHYEYPELLADGRGSSNPGAEDKETNNNSSNVIDLMGSPAILAMTGEGSRGGQERGGRFAAVFCRASLWMTPKIDLLFLDRPMWRDPSSRLRKARRAVSVTRPYLVTHSEATAVADRGKGKDSNLSDEWDVKLAEGDEILSLEDVLQETLKDAITNREVLPDIVSEIAYDRWLELLEVLPPSATRRPTTARYWWQLLHSLEQNADVASYLAHRLGDGDGGAAAAAAYPDWNGLLSRVHRRIDLMPPLTTVIPALTPNTTTTTTTKMVDAPLSKKMNHAGTLPVSLKSGSAVPSSRAGREPTADENQRALDRVSYLGGILIPLPIVSGILSMGDTYGPQGPQFYIFWAVAIPLALVTVLIIYADIIRKAEVWVEVAAEQVVAGGFSSGTTTTTTTTTSTTSKANGAVQEIDMKKQRRTVTWGRQHRQPPQGISEGQPPSPSPPPPAQGRVYSAPPEAVAYTVVDNEAEERIIDMPTAAMEMPQPDADAVEEVTEEDMEVPAFPHLILERPTDGSKPRRAWKRQQMGWFGAVKYIVGVGRPRPVDDMPQGEAVAYDNSSKLGRRKTRTY